MEGSREEKINECIVRGVVSANYLEEFLMKLEMCSAPHLQKFVFLSVETTFQSMQCKQKLYSREDRIMPISEISSAYLTDDVIRKNIETTPITM